MYRNKCIKKYVKPEGGKLQNTPERYKSRLEQMERYHL